MSSTFYYGNTVTVTLEGEGILTVNCLATEQKTLKTFWAPRHSAPRMHPEHSDILSHHRVVTLTDNKKKSGLPVERESLSLLTFVGG